MLCINNLVSSFLILQDIEVGKAVRPQLAKRVANAAEAWKKVSFTKIFNRVTYASTKSLSIFILFFHLHHLKMGNIWSQSGFVKPLVGPPTPAVAWYLTLKL